MRMQQGLLITIDGLPGSGKTTQRDLLVNRLRAVFRGDVVSSQDIELPDRPRLSTMTDQERNLRIAIEGDELMINHVLARKRAIEGAIVVFERHICTAFAMDWMNARGAIDLTSPYLRYLDERFCAPDCAMILCMHVPALHRRLMRLAQLEKLRLSREEMISANNDLREYDDCGCGHALALSGEHSKAQIARRIWTHFHERFPELLPDESA